LLSLFNQPKWLCAGFVLQCISEMTSSTWYTTTWVLNNRRRRLAVAVGACELYLGLSLSLSLSLALSISISLARSSLFDHSPSIIIITISSLQFFAFSSGRRAHCCTNITIIIYYCHRHYILLLLLLLYYMRCRRHRFVHRYIGVYCYYCRRPAGTGPTKSTDRRRVRATPNAVTGRNRALSPPSSTSHDTVRGLRTLSLDRRRQSTCCARDDYLICHTRVWVMYIYIYILYYIIKAHNYDDGDSCDGRWTDCRQ